MYPQPGVMHTHLIKILTMLVKPLIA